MQSFNSEKSDFRFNRKGAKALVARELSEVLKDFSNNPDDSLLKMRLNGKLGRLKRSLNDSTSTSHKRFLLNVEKDLIKAKKLFE